MTVALLGPSLQILLLNQQSLYVESFQMTKPTKKNKKPQKVTVWSTPLTTFSRTHFCIARFDMRIMTIAAQNL